MEGCRFGDDSSDAHLQDSRDKSRRRRRLKKATAEAAVVATEVPARPGEGEEKPAEADWEGVFRCLSRPGILAEAKIALVDTFPKCNILL